MAITGTKTGTLQTIVNSGGISANTTLNLSGSANPTFGVSCPAALAGTITSGTVTLSASTTMAGTEKIGVFWTISGVNYQRLGCTIASGTGTAFALTGGSGTTLPGSGQAVTIAIGQDITGGVSIVGSNLIQLLATATLPGAVEWIDVTPTVQRTSTIAAANGFDTWPTTNPVGSVPFSATVLTLRCYNSNASGASTVNVGAILA